MTRSESLWQWTKCVSRNMPELSVSQARLLAWWSYGIALTGTCGRSTVATFLGLLCEEKVANIEQRESAGLDRAGGRHLSARRSSGEHSHSRGQGPGQQHQRNRSTHGHENPLPSRI